MRCDEVRPRLDAYFDGELPRSASGKFEEFVCLVDPAATGS